MIGARFARRRQPLVIFHLRRTSYKTQNYTANWIGGSVTRSQCSSPDNEPDLTVEGKGRVMLSSFMRTTVKLITLTCAG